MSARYRYAFDVHDNVQDVTTLERPIVKDLGPFSCVGCGAPLIAKLGTKNIKHFAHASNEGCGSETYLHKLGKSVFMRTYNACLENKKPFLVALDTAYECNHYEKLVGGPCRYNRIEKYDLTRYFDEVSEEVWHEGFKPDVLLRSSQSGDVVFVEIAVHHKSSEEKLGSGQRIIEYDLDSEDDVVRLENTYVDEDMPGVQLVNFSPKKRVGDICRGQCDHTFDYFVIDRRGRASILHAKPADLVEHIESDKVVLAEPCKDLDNQLQEFSVFIRSAVIRGVEVRSCLACVHGSVGAVSCHIVCNKKYKNITPNEAFRCVDFSLSRS